MKSFKIIDYVKVLGVFLVIFEALMLFSTGLLGMPTLVASVFSILGTVYATRGVSEELFGITYNLMVYKKPF